MKYRNIYKFTTTHFLYLIAYMLFMFLMFNRDVSDTEVLYVLTVPAKFITLLLLTCGIFDKAYLTKNFKWIFVLLFIDFFVLINSGVLTFLLISLLAFFSTQIKDKEIIKIAYYTLLLYTAIVLLFCAIGIYSDVITNRWVGSSDRHSFGFSHSNVLPLIYSYLIGYGLAIGNYKKRHYIFLIFLDLLIFHFCGSRNALIATLLLIAGKIISDLIIRKKYKKHINLILCFLAKFIIPVLSLISLGVPFFLNKIQVFKTLDFLLSYRFTYIAKIIKNEGIHFVTKMSNEMYFRNQIVIDNGYAFLAVRYGLLILIFLSFLTYNIAKKYKDNTYVLILIIVVAFCNLIDNDLIDYCCLPYLIISEKCIIEGIKRRRKFYG